MIDDDVQGLILTFTRREERGGVGRGLFVFLF